MKIDRLGRKVFQKEVKRDRIPKDEKLCRVKVCLKECNSESKDPKMRGYYIGKPFVYEESMYACYLCGRQHGNLRKGSFGS